MNRDEFLARVRQAAEQGLAHRAHVRPFPPDAGYVGCPGDRCEALAREVIGVGGEAAIAATFDDARRLLAEWLAAESPRAILAWRHPLLDQVGLREAAAGLGAELWTHDELAPLEADERRARVLAAAVGVTSCEYAIAETGSLAVAARPGSERAASLTPPVHLAVVAESQIVADLYDLFARFAERGLDGLPSNIALITGPSKTGDIELQLTTGVHGPGRWRVLVVRGV